MSPQTNKSQSSISKEQLIRLDQQNRKSKMRYSEISKENQDNISKIIKQKERESIQSNVRHSQQSKNQINKSKTNIKQNNQDIQNNTQKHRKPSNLALAYQLQKYDSNQTDQSLIHQHPSNININNILKNKKFPKPYTNIQATNNDSSPSSLQPQNTTFLTQNNFLPKNSSYIEWKVYKNRPNINMLPFPYCYTEQQTIFDSNVNKIMSPFQLGRLFKKSHQHNQNNTSLNSSININNNSLNSSFQPRHPQSYRLKLQNKLLYHQQKTNQKKSYLPNFNCQKTPLNEYLNFQLSQQINNKVRQVQIMAEEIKKQKNIKN